MNRYRYLFVALLIACTTSFGSTTDTAPHFANESIIVLERGEVGPCPTHCWDLSGDCIPGCS